MELLERLAGTFDEDRFTSPAQHNLKSLRIHHVLTEFLCFLAADFFIAAGLLRVILS